MNPPSALHGAMSRERKPFTYTPGGLDLSEIKSERMAKRLMKNAMDQGVPEVAVNQSIKSPTTPIAVPNFNCLPVQVFPTFQLPSNPKSLLRTRSTPTKRDSVTDSVTLQANNNFVSKQQQSNNNYYDNKPNYFDQQQVITIDKPREDQRNLPSFEYNLQTNNNYCNQISTSKIDSNNVDLPTHSLQSSKLNQNKILPSELISNFSNNNNSKANEMCNKNYIHESVEPILNNNSHWVPQTEETDLNVANPISLCENGQDNFTIKPLIPTLTKDPLNDNDVKEQEQNEEPNEITDYEKVVKKVKKEKKEVETHNGDAEAEVTLTLTPKKSKGKTETTVEVQTKVLPDGTVEEKKITTTKTTIDGRTEIATKTETKTIPPESKVETEEEEEEEEEEELIVEEPEEQEEVVEESRQSSKITTVTKEAIKENGHSENIIKHTEEVTAANKVQTQNEVETEEEEEEESEEEQEEPPISKTETTEKLEQVEKKVEGKVVEQKVVEDEKEEEEEEYEDEEEEVVKTEATTLKNENIKVTEEKKEEIVEKVVEASKEKEEEISQETEEEEEAEEEEEEEEQEVEPPKQVQAQKIEETKEEVKNDNSVQKEDQEQKEEPEQPKEPIPEKKIENAEVIKEQVIDPTPVIKQIPIIQPEPIISVDIKPISSVDIKPIAPASESISRSHTEKTEIKLTETLGRPSFLTESHTMENLVTVNKTTTSLDKQYQQITQHGVPTVKTYFAPSRDRISISPSRPYEPAYHPGPQPERRHSLLLERLSMERQAPPTEQYQYTNQQYESQQQWSQEPQAEVVNASNVKPSSITNSQWYQPSQKDNILYNNVKPSPETKQWSQPSYTENVTQTSSDLYQQTYLTPAPAPAPAPKPNTWTSNNLGQIDSLPSIITPSNQYSYLTSDNTETYKQSSQKSTQQYSPSYVPPPWEQDSSFVPPPIQNTNQNIYQPSPATDVYRPNVSWQPEPAPTTKYSKPPPTSYRPPAPNQSFVKAGRNTEPPSLPGRKTYYSEYERRYISVPESTYIPAETKYQPQQDASPQYYYDNNEPRETIEPEWRKELREFTEKSQNQQTQQTQYSTVEESSVQPPWESRPNFAKAEIYTPTPTWSQTLKPQTRERSFESEYVGSQNWKSNTIGRGRPVSSYIKSSVDTIPERTRGVSVDRYNPSSYHPPASSLLPAGEHPPPVVQTLTPAPPGKTNYHNPNVPAYHTRPAAEARDQNVVSQQQTRVWGNEARESPIQSRSFKYLQWITGTDE